MKLESIPLVRIIGEEGFRREFSPESVAELAASIRELGLLQPVLVRKRGDSYELIAGRRRIRAFRELEREEIPALVIESDDVDAELAQLAENVQREALDPFEEALALKHLKEEYGLTDRELAEKVGKGASWVNKMLKVARLADKLEEYPRLRELPRSELFKLSSVKGEELDALLESRFAEAQGRKRRRRARSARYDLERSSWRLLYRSEKLEVPKSRLAELESELSKLLGNRRFTVRIEVE